jgi:hypothetical protein
MVADILSSHLQIIFIPPAHFSMVILHRGTIIHCGADGIADDVPIPPAWPVPMPGIPIPARSITIALVIGVPLPLLASIWSEHQIPFERSSICRHYPDRLRSFNINPQEYYESNITI